MEVVVYSNMLMTKMGKKATTMKKMMMRIKIWREIRMAKIYSCRQRMLQTTMKVERKGRQKMSLRLLLQKKQIARQ